jgi:putative salt-induced outer membrane protein YdiY
MSRRAIRVFALGLLLAPAAALAQDPPPPEPPPRPWTDVADFSAIVTSGNSESTSFAFTNKYVYKWATADFTLDAAALRTESTTRTLTNPGGTVVETETTEKTAENYLVGAKYRGGLDRKLYWYAGAGWLRNEFAGVEDRYVAGAGIGYFFLKDEKQSFLGELGLDYTDETQVGGVDDQFAGVRAYLAYERSITAASKFTTDLAISENLDDTDDLRAKSVTALTASISARTALKVSYTILYDHQPVEQIIPPDATAPPGTPGAIFVFDDVDTIFAASVVVNF